MQMAASQGFTVNSSADISIRRYSTLFNFGYFSFVAQEGDTLEFSAIGFVSTFFIIPDTLTNYKYSLIQVLKMDTISLPMTNVYPWPNASDFKKAFLALQLPEDDITRADRNMARSDTKERMTGMAMEKLIPARRAEKI